MTQFQTISHEQNINGLNYEFELAVHYAVCSDGSDGHYWLETTNESIDAANSTAMFIDNNGDGHESQMKYLIADIDKNAVFSQIEIEL